MSLSSQSLKLKYIDLGVFTSLQKEGKLNPLSLVGPDRVNDPTRWPVVGPSLWGKLPRSLMKKIHKALGINNPYPKDRKNFFDLSPGEQSVLLYHGTYWFRELPQSIRGRIFKVFLEGKQVEKLRQILIDCDGQLYKLIIATYDEEWTWERVLRYQVRLISNLVQNAYAFLKPMKKYLGYMKHKCFNEDPALPSPDPCELPPCWGDIKRIYSRILALPNTRKNVWRKAVLLQVRSTGLHSEAIKDSKESFLQTLGDPTPCPNPDQYNDIVPKVLEPALRLKDLARRREKIVISNSACLEVPLAKGGKSELIRRLNLIADRRLSIDMSSGELVEVDRPKFGNHILAICVKAEREPCYRAWLLNKLGCKYDTNVAKVAFVLETGLKARLVTVGSGIRATILQIASHFLLECLKAIPEVRSAVSLSNHAWEYFVRFDMENPNFPDLIGREQVTYSTDLSEATDHCYRSVAINLVRTALDFLGFPHWLTELSMELWCGPMTYIVDGIAHKSLYRVVEQGKPLTKAFLLLAQLVASYTPRPHGIMAFNGDDCIITTNERLLIDVYRTRIINMGFKISNKDTFLSRWIGNFCEEWFFIPHHWTQTYRVQLRTNNTENCLFIDIPKIRLLINVSRTRENFSSTCMGKISLLSKRLAYTSSGPSFELWPFLYFLQDSCLCYYKDFKVAYLPGDLGGAQRVPAQFNTFDMTRFYSLERRKYREKVFYLIRNFMDYYDQIEYALDPIVPEPLNRFWSSPIPKDYINEGQFLMDDSYYADRIRDLMPKALVKGPCIEERLGLTALTRYGLLVTEHAIKIACFVQESMLYLLGYIPKPRVRSSTYKELDKMDPVDNVWVPEWPAFVQRLKRATVGQLFFRPSVIDEIYGRGLLTVNTDEDISEEFIPSNYQEAKLFELLTYFSGRNRDISLMPRYYVDDDFIIVNLVRRARLRTVSIVTFDFALCRKLSYERRTVYAYNPVYYLCGELDLDDTVIVDTGSVESSIERYFKDGYISHYLTCRFDWDRRIPNIVGDEELFDFTMLKELEFIGPAVRTFYNGRETTVR